jgi:menaquinol-cytochrome c reductase iron-sulfur subunit
MTMQEEIIAQSKNVRRRGLLKGIVYGLAPLLGGTLITSIGEYLLANPEVDDSGWADAGDISDLKPGAPEEISFARSRIDGWKVRNERSAAWVVLDNQKKITAFSPACTHLGCAYHWQAEHKTFLCPCHGSVFSANGDVISGPANRPLDRYTVKVEAGRLWLGPVENPKNS